jgi:hypothetical protein
LTSSELSDTQPTSDGQPYLSKPSHRRPGRRSYPGVTVAGVKVLACEMPAVSRTPLATEPRHLRPFAAPMRPASRQVWAGRPYLPCSMGPSGPCCRVPAGRRLGLLLRHMGGDCESEGQTWDRYEEHTQRLMQNLAVNPSTGFLARLLQKSRTRLTNTRQRLLRPIERRFLSQTFHDGEAVAVRAYVRTGRRSTRRT